MDALHLLTYGVCLGVYGIGLVFLNIYLLFIGLADYGNGVAECLHLLTVVGEPCEEQHCSHNHEAEDESRTLGPQKPSAEVTLNEQHIRITLGQRGETPADDGTRAPA